MDAPLTGCVPGASATSADVFLDDAGRPHLRAFRIAAGFAQRAPLTQQVPALVELHLDALEPTLIRVGKRPLFHQPMLLSDEFLDVHQDSVVAACLFHADLLRRNT
jgi:hypothetical protein